MMVVSVLVIVLETMVSQAVNIAYPVSWGSVDKVY